MLLFLPATLPPVFADTVQVVVRIDEQGARLVDAIHQTAPLGPSRTQGQPSLATIQAISSTGQVLSSSPLVDPRWRSIVGEHEGGQGIQLSHALARVELEWPDGAVEVRIDEEALRPRQVASWASPDALVQVNASGTADERLNMVFLGDGYIEGELDVFASDVDRISEYMFNEIEPYGSYSTAFNIWRIDRASQESGASHYEWNPQVLRDTAYGCYYGCAGIERLICCNDSDVVTEVNALIPEADGIMVLVNDPVYGGSGGFTYATSYTEGETGEMVASHELGHSLIGLWDEYDYGYNAGYNGGPNCSAEGDGSSWAHWLDKDEVDAFATCSYRDLYRPTPNDCMMNSLQGNYCPVCREHTVRVIYDHLPSLFASTSAPEGPLVLAGKAVTIQIEATLPEVETLVWEWALEDEWMGEESELTLSPCGPSGTLRLTVQDTTDYVRSDPTALLTDSLQWNIERPDCTTADTGELNLSSGPEIEDGNIENCGCKNPAGSTSLLLLTPWLWRRQRRSNRPT